MAASSIFRGLIIASLALLVVTFIATWTVPDLPEDVAAYIDSQNVSSLGAALAHGNVGTQLLVGILIYGFFFAYVVALIGLLRFQGWARTLFIMLVPLSLALQAAQGTTISRPIDTFDMAAAMINGALLVLLFVEPVRARFREAAAAPLPPPPPPAAPYPPPPLT
jgi:hypothetical protein